jgi:hypothetical protein
MTPKEQADLDFINAQRDQIYLDKGVVPEYTIAKELKQNSTYTNLTDEHIEELEEYANGFEPDTNELEPGTEQEAQSGEEETGEPGEESKGTGGEVS